MGGRLFDSFLMVDWSAAARPVTGANSVWWALLRPEAGLVARANPPTRMAAMDAISRLLAEETAAGRRVLAGFDFPFGYPEGAAARLAGRPGWRALWAMLAEALPETPDNANDRFRLAARLNAAWEAPGPFWGYPGPRAQAGLPCRKPAGWGGTLPAEWRVAERIARSGRGAKPKSVWQLSGAGSVGSQALTGIAALERLRRRPGIVGQAVVWPFETGLAPPRAPICLAEVYPSLVPADPAPGEVTDAAQVRALAARLSAIDAEGGLGALFEARALEDAGARRAVAAEEAWILGAGAADRLAPAAPARIGGEAARARAAADLRAATRLDHLPAALHPLALAVVAASGRPETADRLVWSEGAGEAGRAALAAGAPVLTDCPMVATGLARAGLPAGNPTICTAENPRLPRLAAERGLAPAAAAVDLWADRIGGAVVAIGTEAAALARLHRRLLGGWPRPALVLAFPVGFDGAAVAKAALAAESRGTAFVALRGRAGGAPLAVAAVRALAGERP